MTAKLTAPELIAIARRRSLWRFAAMFWLGTLFGIALGLWTGGNMCGVQP